MKRTVALIVALALPLAGIAPAQAERPARPYVCTTVGDPENGGYYLCVEQRGKPVKAEHTRKLPLCGTPQARHRTYCANPDGLPF